MEVDYSSLAYVAIVIFTSLQRSPKETTATQANSSSNLISEQVVTKVKITKANSNATDACLKLVYFFVMLPLFHISLLYLFGDFFLLIEDNEQVEVTYWPANLTKHAISYSLDIILFKRINPSV